MNLPVPATLTTHDASPWGGTVTKVCGYDPATHVILSAYGLVLIIAGGLSLIFHEGKSSRKVMGLYLIGLGLAFVSIRLISWLQR